MKKHIVLSVNENPKYLFYVPLIIWAWRHFDWEPILFYQGEKNALTGLIHDTTENDIHEGMTAEMKSLYRIRPNILNPIEGYKSETITQVSRLYGACVADGYMMTSDIDMLPLSNYWEPDLKQCSVYGRDLTDYHYPICYIGMPTTKWREVMYITGEWGYDSSNFNAMIKRDLDVHFDKSATREKQWCYDQDLITARINESTIFPIRLDRGTDKRTGYPIGRVDRSSWTLNHPVLIDAHLPHDILTNEASFKKVMELLHTVWPKEDFKWVVNYYKEFKKLC